MSPHHSGSATAIHSNPLAAQPAANRPSQNGRRSSAAPTSNRHRPAPASLSSPVHAAIAQPIQHLSYFQQHTAELAAYITQIFLPSVLPTAEEYQIKEQTRQYLETLADKVSPGARLLPFGSIASGLALRNSDMDLCCLIDKPSASSSSPASSTAAPSMPPKHTPAEMVMILGKLIQEETSFMVKMLPKARIPIIKLSLPPSAGQPFGLSCDIGFENRLALENTRLLLTYAMVDPRMRTIVLFLKVWTKRRRINDPYLGTLSSYGYVLLVIYYLVNNRKSAVLPNLQQLPPPRPTPPEDLYLHGHSIYFFDDLDALPRYWSSNNRENVGELLIDFFRFFASSFRYTHDVISVRSIGGLVSKESKGWMHDIIEDGNGNPENAGGGTRGPYGKVDLNRLCIEDPFQTNYNVARTVTRDGLFTIRGEFMRAVRVLSTRTDRLDVMIRELCEERQEGVLMAPPSSSGRRKSAPNPKPTHAVPPLELMSPLTASQGQPTRGCWTASSTSSSARLINEESQDAEFQQILIQQQQETLRQRLQLQDYVYRQATSSTDARPRYPPESIASEPVPELDWNQSCHQHYHHQQHDPSIDYQLENEIQALQIHANINRNDDPTSVTSNNENSINDTNAAAGGGGSGANYFHRFFRAGGGCANANSSASASKTETIYESSSSNTNHPNPTPNATNTSTNGYHHNHHHHQHQHQQQLYQHQLLLYQQQQPTFLDFSCIPTPGPIRFGNFSGGISATTTGGGGGNGENGAMIRKSRAASSQDLPSRIIFGDVEVMTPVPPPPPQPPTTTSSSSTKNGTSTSRHNKKERVASSESSSSNNHHSHTNNNRDRDRDKDQDSNRVVSRSAGEV